MVNRCGNCSEKNVEPPFTELFALIKLYDFLPDGFKTVGYNVDEIKRLSRHANNAINITLQGLQDIGSLINLVEQSKSKISDDLNGIGYLIVSISNLVEALYILKTHADFALLHANSTCP